MQNFRKIKKLNDQKKEKQYALSEMLLKQKSFLKQSKPQPSFQQSSIESESIDAGFFVIKNLDNNKLEIYKDEKHIEEELLSCIDQIPEIQQLLKRIWDEYLNDLEKEEEQFLQACYQGDVKRVKRGVSNQNRHPIDTRLVCTDEGKNGIHLATISGSYRNVEIIRVLAEYSVDINGRTHQELRTPLMLGAILGNEVAVEELLKLKADTTLQDYEGNTALHHACIYNQEKIAKLLLEHHCPIEIKNNKNETALDVSSASLLALITQYQTVSQEVVKQAQYLLESRIEQKGDVETEQGWSGLAKADKVGQIAIKQIGLNSFKKLSLLGRGAFGQVYLAQNQQDSRCYAVKALDKASIMRQNILRYAMTERKILSTVNHPFIVKLRFAFQSPQKLYLVMDYCPGGDLLAMIKREGVLQQQVLRKYMAEIVLAIEALHRAQIIYRDLKPSNIIIDSEGHACLTDFGLSKQASLSHSFCGSTAYLAPEMLWRRGHTKVLDWYLLGVVIYECLTGRPPFWDSSKQQLLANIKSGRYKQLGSDFSREVRDLVEKLLRSNSTKRLGVNGSSEVKAHPWFSCLDWAVVEARGLKMPAVMEMKGKAIKQQFFEDVGANTDQIKGWDYNPSKQF